MKLSEFDLHAGNFVKFKFLGMKTDAMLRWNAEQILRRFRNCVWPLGDEVDVPIGDPDLILKWYNWVCENIGPSKVCRDIRLIKGFYRWLGANRLVNFDAAAMLPVPKYNPRPPKATITEEQFRMIQRGARNSWIIWPVTLSWYTGMAWVDCCHLKWNEIDFHRRIITKRRSKSSTICQIPFLENGELHRNLLAKQAAREPRQPMTGETCVDGDEYVCAVSARRYHGRGRDAFTRALVAVGLNGRGISIHSLRVSFCSRMANSGVSSAVAMRMTGHTNGTMFARYVRCDVGALHQALEQSISGQPAPQPTGQLPPDPAIISITPHLSRPEMPDSMDNLL